MIATYVSSENDFYTVRRFTEQLQRPALMIDEGLVKKVKLDFRLPTSPTSGRRFSLSPGRCSEDGKERHGRGCRARARKGATDIQIHDTVLIAAAFCMYNRYVDGLGTTQPRDEAMYRERGKRVA